MPLVKGDKARSNAGISKNISTEIKNGKPKNQAIALAMSEAKKGKRGKKKGCQRFVLFVLVVVVTHSKVIYYSMRQCRFTGT